MKRKSRKERKTKDHSSFLREDGNARSAKTTISRVEKNVIDARKLGLNKILQANHSIC